ncbi:MAG TPA: hypothetical protein VK513_06715, partial [Terriglobales bacterium]|nr:hypothetical protein [Terriglobales bacterium]
SHHYIGAEIGAREPCLRGRSGSVAFHDPGAKGGEQAREGWRPMGWRMLMLTVRWNLASAEADDTVQLGEVSAGFLAAVLGTRTVAFFPPLPLLATARARAPAAHGARPNKSLQYG